MCDDSPQFEGDTSLCVGISVLPVVLLLQLWSQLPCLEKWADNQEMLPHLLG